MTHTHARIKAKNQVVRVETDKGEHLYKCGWQLSPSFSQVLIATATTVDLFKP